MWTIKIKRKSENKKYKNLSPSCLETDYVPVLWKFRFQFPAALTPHQAKQNQYAKQKKRLSKN